MCKKIIFSIILLVGTFGPFGPHDASTLLAAQPGVMAASQSVWPHEKSDLTLDPGIVVGRLGNGFRYVLM